MSPALFSKQFPGLNVSIREVHKHPCLHSVHAHHINVGYYLVQFEITKEHPFVKVRYLWMKMVTVKDSWNIKISNECVNLIAIEKDDVILDVGYTLGKYKGNSADRITFTTKSIKDGTQTLHNAFIVHSVKSH